MDLRHSPAVVSGWVFSSKLSVSSSQISSSQHMIATSPDPRLAWHPAEPKLHPLEAARHSPEWVLLSGLSAVPVDLSLRASGRPVRGAQEPYDLHQADSAKIILFYGCALKVIWEDPSRCVSSFCQKIVTREKLILCPRNYCVVII